MEKQITVFTQMPYCAYISSNIIFLRTSQLPLITQHIAALLQNDNNQFNYNIVSTLLIKHDVKHLSTKHSTVICNRLLMKCRECDTSRKLITAYLLGCLHLVKQELMRHMPEINLTNSITYINVLNRQRVNVTMRCQWNKNQCSVCEDVTSDTVTQMQLQQLHNRCHPHLCQSLQPLLTNTATDHNSYRRVTNLTLMWTVVHSCL